MRKTITHLGQPFWILSFGGLAGWKESRTENVDCSIAYTLNPMAFPSVFGKTNSESNNLVKVVSNSGNCLLKGHTTSGFVGKRFRKVYPRHSGIQFAFLTKAYFWNMKITLGFFMWETICLTGYHYTLACFFLKFIFIDKLKFILR